MTAVGAYLDDEETTDREALLILELLATLATEALLILALLATLATLWLLLLPTLTALLLLPYVLPALLIVLLLFPAFRFRCSCLNRAIDPIETPEDALEDRDFLEAADRAADTEEAAADAEELASDWESLHVFP